MVEISCSIRKELLNGIRLKVIEMLIPNTFSNLGGYLSGKGRVSLLNVDCTLEGQFVNGKLHGPVRGLTTKGTKVQLISKANFKVFI